MTDPMPEALRSCDIDADVEAVRRMVEGGTPEARAVACRLIREWADVFGVVVPDWSRLASAYAAAWRGLPDWALVGAVQDHLAARTWRSVPLPGEIRAAAEARVAPVADALRSLSVAAMVRGWSDGR